jgi:hypothetical protein
MTEKEARSMIVTLRRALMMIVAWADDWLLRHPEQKDRQT